MTKSYDPFGPYYLTLVFESERRKDGEAVATAYIDGFQSEADAWRACHAFGVDAIDAVDEEGEMISVAGGALLQVTIARTAAADAPQFLAAQ